MSTAAKPLADHGTYARARGNHRSGKRRCHCQPCRAAEQAYTKRRRYLKANGRGLLVEAAPVAAHLKMLMAGGDALTVIAEKIGHPRSTLANVLSGRTKKVRRPLAEKVLAVRPGTAIAGNRSVPAIGAVRRLRALVALEHALKDICKAAKVEESTASYLLNNHAATIHYELAMRIDSGYRQLCTRRGTSVRSLRRASREGWAPPGAWDDDTIDDPNAHPDWTGHCGTDRGYWVHTLQKLTVCARCAEAHEQWVADHAHLTPKDRAEQLFTQRAKAASREAALAEDARELLRLEIPVDVAAARLGVTRNHLQQAMKRHPERLDTAA